MRCSQRAQRAQQAQHAQHPPVKAKMGQSGRQRLTRLAITPRRVNTKMAAALRLSAIMAAAVHTSSVMRPVGVVATVGSAIWPCLSCLRACERWRGWSGVGWGWARECVCACVRVGSLSCSAVRYAGTPIVCRAATCCAHGASRSNPPSAGGASACFSASHTQNALLATHSPAWPSPTGTHLTHSLVPEETVRSSSINSCGYHPPFPPPWELTSPTPQCAWRRCAAPPWTSAGSTPPPTRRTA